MRFSPTLRLLILLSFAWGSGEPAHALDPRKSISQFTHTAWSAKDGIPGPVQAMAQTDDGYLWLGTPAGLYRFDGLHFVPWEPGFGEQQPIHSVSSLFVARDGALWIGFGSGGISRLSAGHFTIYSPREGVPGGGVSSIAQDLRGAIWAGGQYGFSKFEQGQWRQVGLEAGYPAPGAQQIVADRRGYLWVETDGWSAGSGTDPVLRNAILTLAPDTTRFLNTGLRSRQRGGMTATPDGEVWLFRSADNTLRKISGIVRPDDGLPVVPGYSSPGLFDRDGSLWAPILHHGIGRVAGRQAQGNTPLDQYGPNDGLSGSEVYSSLEDYEGNVWIGTDGGLDRFAGNKVTSFSAREGLDPDQYIALSATSDGSVWIVNYTRDVVQRYRDGVFRTSHLLPYSRFDTSRILSLYTEGTNTVWVGGSFGLARGIDGRFSYLPTAALGKGANVESLAKDAAGNLWIAQTRWLSETGVDSVGGILRFRDGAWTDLRQRFALPNFRCRVIHADPQGGVWFGFENGQVAAYENDTLRIYSISDGLPDGAVLTISSDRSGNLWVGGEGGLSRLRNGRFVTLTLKSGLPGNSVAGIVEDDDGMIWLAGSLGILRVAPRELDAALESPVYRLKGAFFGPSDGLRGLPRQREPFPVAARAADGRLWFATTGGVAVIDPRNWAKNHIPPAVVIETVDADDHSYSDLAGLRLPPNTRNLEFRFAALSLTDPTRVRFRYRLEGYDADWRGPVEAREAKYTNLPPRDYRFRVIASNNDGVWNLQGATAHFSIIPAFYQTNSFRVLCAVLLATLVWMVYRLRLRQMATRLDTQFEARLAERTRIAQELHDTLLQGILSASMLLHVVDKHLPAQSPAKPLLDRVLDLIRQVSADGRNAIQGLRLAVLDSDNLEQSFSRIPRELGIQKMPDYRVVVQGQPRALHPVIRDEVYRIGREAVANAFRHSEAHLIEVELEYMPARLRIVVRDDGCGIDEDVLRSGRAGHWGLSGMRGRASKIGARLKVFSRVPGGTEIELSVPGQVAFRAWHGRQGLGRRRRSELEQ